MEMASRERWKAEIRAGRASPDLSSLPVLHGVQERRENACPLAPMGCPSAIAPPLTLTRFQSQRSSSQLDVASPQW